MMYNYNDVECIAMLRMKRVPFFSLCNLLRSRKLVPETVGCPVEERWQCLYMWLDTTRGLG
jgi:hypothetical protein